MVVFRRNPIFISKALLGPHYSRTRYQQLEKMHNEVRAWKLKARIYLFVHRID